MLANASGTCVLTNTFASVLDLAVYGVRWAKFAVLTNTFTPRHGANAAPTFLSAPQIKVKSLNGRLINSIHILKRACIYNAIM